MSKRLSLELHCQVRGKQQNVLRSSKSVVSIRLSEDPPFATIVLERNRVKNKIDHHTNKGMLATEFTVDI